MPPSPNPRQSEEISKSPGLVAPSIEPGALYGPILSGSSLHGPILPDTFASPQLSVSAVAVFVPEAFPWRDWLYPFASYDLIDSGPFSSFPTLLPVDKIGLILLA